MADETPHVPAVPWALTALLREGAAPVTPPAEALPERLDIALVMADGISSAAAAGLPDELLDELERLGAEITLLEAEDAVDGLYADVMLAAGWYAAPAVLTLDDVRARALLAAADAPPLADLGWTDTITVLGPRWMGGTLGAGADSPYRALPTHRSEGVIHLHGEDPLCLLTVEEVVRLRPEVKVSVSGVRFPVSLPFAAEAIEPDADQIAHAFSSATVGLAPPVRGWRPAATGMLACGLPVVTADTEAARLALGDAGSYMASPLTGADTVIDLLDDITLRAERARAGNALVRPWSEVAVTLYGQLRAL